MTVFIDAIQDYYATRKSNSLYNLCKDATHLDMPNIREKVIAAAQYELLVSCINLNELFSEDYKAWVSEHIESNKDLKFFEYIKEYRTISFGMGVYTYTNPLIYEFARYHRESSILYIKPESSEQLCNLHRSMGALYKFANVEFPSNLTLQNSNAIYAPTCETNNKHYRYIFIDTQEDIEDLARAIEVYACDKEQQFIRLGL